MPHRITEKAPPGGRKKTLIERPLEKGLRDELASIFQKCADGSMEIVEDEIQETIPG